jgi:Mg2+ and Co2+ transporter CorA
LNLRQSIEPHRDILHQFEEQAPVFFGPQYAPSVRMLMNEYYRVHNHIMRETENLHELRATNNSLVETKQNDVIQRLTAGALITFPLALITSVLGLNVPGNPILQHPNAFWVITCIVAVGAGSLAYYFGKKGWL